MELPEHPVPRSAVGLFDKDLTDEETATLLAELDRIIENYAISCGRGFALPVARPERDPGLTRDYPKTGRQQTKHLTPL
jgi:hypothetical protein